MGLWRRLRFVGAFASPLLFVMGVFALIPGMDPDVLPGEARDYTGVWGNLHRTLGALALGAFGLSAAAAGMYLTQERDLKIHKFRAILFIGGWFNAPFRFSMATCQFYGKFVFINVLISCKYWALKSWATPAYSLYS